MRLHPYAPLPSGFQLGYIDRSISSTLEEGRGGRRVCLSPSLWDFHKLAVISTDWRSGSCMVALSMLPSPSGITMSSPGLWVETRPLLTASGYCPIPGGDEAIHSTGIILIWPSHLFSSGILTHLLCIEHCVRCLVQRWRIKMMENNIAAAIYQELSIFQRPCLSLFCVLSHSIPAALWERDYYLHFTDEVTENLSNFHKITQPIPLESQLLPSPTHPPVCTALFEALSQGDTHLDKWIIILITCCGMTEEGKGKLCLLS